MVVAFLATTGTYLLDRVGVGTTLPDRADVASQPRRVHFLRRTMPAARAWAFALLVVALALISSEGLLAALVVPLSLVGMLLYGHTTGPRRVKDVLVMKNVAVGVSLVALALVLGTVDIHGIRVSALVVAGSALLLHVIGGAMLCDLDDQHADARRGTKTIPNHLGPRITWWLADALAVAAGGIVWLGGAMGWIAVYWWPLAILPSAAVLLLHLIKPRRVRHVVDISFPLMVVIGVLISVAIGTEQVT